MIGNKFPNKASFTYRKAVQSMLRTKEDMADNRDAVDTVDRSRLNLLISLLILSLLSYFIWKYPINTTKFIKIIN